MLRKLYRLFNFLKLKAVNERILVTEEKKVVIPRTLSQTRKRLEELFTNCSDFKFREVIWGDEAEVKVIVAFIDGLVEKAILDGQIIQALMTESRIAHIESHRKNEMLDILEERLLITNEVRREKDFNRAVDFILMGDTVLFIEGSDTAFVCGTKGWEGRPVGEPDTESVVRGPREGFVETIRVNTSLLRRKVKSTNLKIESMTIGRYTLTEVCICYIKGLAREDILETVRRRLKKIKTDAILESGYIEEFIEDAPYSIFPTVGNSEKPDIVAGKLLEGRIAIMVDGTPFVLTVPQLMIETLQASEDYYSRPFFSSIDRILRFLAFSVSIGLPAFYVALISFHQDVIPFKLALTMAESRQGLPFSPFTEALFMGVIFELLREAGVRMPRPVGQAVSIVGALVLGESAVRAGLASNPMVIVTSLTAISSFIIPALRGVMPILRIILLVAANILGFLGIILGLVLIFVHLCTLRSFGVPYLFPFSPLSVVDLKDTFIRAPLWLLFLRPKLLNEDSQKNRYRMQVNYRKKED